MKKLVLVCALFIAGSLAAVAGPIVTISIEFGKKATDCGGWGICHVTVDNASLLGTFQINDNTNQLILQVSKEAVAGKENYVSGNLVRFDEDIVLPSDVTKALGVKTGIVIKAGSFPVVKTKSGYQISFPLN